MKGNLSFSVQVVDFSNLRVGIGNNFRDLLMMVPHRRVIIHEDYVRLQDEAILPSFLSRGKRHRTHPAGRVPQLRDASLGAALVSGEGGGFVSSEKDAVPLLGTSLQVRTDCMD
ncbi:hypothetical protein GWK47_049898 [Chionoecetes opilio]|uniref:Uncharacterized protein n=1 Tax=Chionoecetes opilio TaxID=41210 RepID=A0A8J4Y9M4_CHIOP|nr:hypothetical protein GWK47_049898 [Chionoecetes opilio]